MNVKTRIEVVEHNTITGEEDRYDFFQEFKDVESYLQVIRGCMRHLGRCTGRIMNGSIHQGWTFEGYMKYDDGTKFWSTSNVYVMPISRKYSGLMSLSRKG